MFKYKQKRMRDEYEDGKARERYIDALAAGISINTRLSELHSLDRSRLQTEARILLLEAKRQTAKIIQSIADRTDYDFGGLSDAEGDLFTFYGDMIAGVMREHSIDPQTVWQALSERIPSAHFTVHLHDAVAMTAAILREERVAGIIEGLEISSMRIDVGL